MSANLFQSQLIEELWYEDNPGDGPYTERYSTKSIVGMKLGDVVRWAQELCKEHGEDSVLSDISTDEEFPSVEIEFSLPDFPPMGVELYPKFLKEIKMRGAGVIGVLIGGAMFVAATIFVVAAIFSLPVYLLWNWLMPSIFGLHEITWLQAWGLLALCGSLFKSSATVKKGE